MKFLVDAQLPPALCAWLESQGHEAAHVTHLGMGDASDAAVADHAAANALIVISKDEDFIVLRRHDRFGLVWLRCGNTTNRALTAWLNPRWPRITTLLDRGEHFIEVI